MNKGSQVAFNIYILEVDAVLGTFRTYDANLVKIEVLLHNIDRQTLVALGISFR